MSVVPRSIIDLSNAPPQLLNPKPFTVQRTSLPFACTRRPKRILVNTLSFPAAVLNGSLAYVPTQVVCDPKCIRWTPHSMGKGPSHMHPSEKKEFYA
jgi:hypothetical protein